MHLELNFRPTVQIITVVRNSVMRLYERVLNDPDTSARIALATHELLENTLRHSVDGNAMLHISVEGPQDAAQDGDRGKGGAQRITIVTRNRATAANIADLTAQAAEMDVQDANAYLIDLMGRCAERDEDGGLGLARVRAEAEMDIAVKTEGDCVSIIASTTNLGAAA